MAQYTLLLKNGGRVTVQSYREEGGMIKFYGLGGEVGIPKDQVQSILRPGEGDPRGMVLPGAGAAGTPEPSREEKRPISGEPAAKAKLEERKEGTSKTDEKALSPEEQLAAERAKEEKEYQRKVKEITEQLKAARDRYAVATRGSSSPEPTLLQSEEAIRARTEDLISRLRDAQHNPAGPSDAGGVKLTTPSPFSGAPPTTTELRTGEVVPRVDAPVPDYSAREKELSELRGQISQLERQRERLIEEMRRKNFDTGSLFLE